MPGSEEQENPGERAGSGKRYSRPELRFSIPTYCIIRMRIRIHFAKTEAMRFTSHLDLHRTWERTFVDPIYPLPIRKDSDLTRE